MAYYHKINPYVTLKYIHAYTNCIFIVGCTFSSHNVWIAMTNCTANGGRLEVFLTFQYFSSSITPQKCIYMQLGMQISHE